MRWYAAPGFSPDPSAPLPLLVSDAPCLFRQTAMAALDAAGRAWPEISLCLVKDAYRVRPTVARLGSISKEVAAESCLT
jgi:hypothetical protein